MKCTGCGICEKACPKHAISFEDGRIRVGYVLLFGMWAGFWGGSCWTPDLNTTWCC
ncbi:MAG: 4Fe-4S binding protein [ANME-2 cluster archaeon]|nr:4Fe-4S binding protein [ANME-2 cluster archaeon]